MHTMFKVSFLCLLLIPYLCYALEYYRKQNGNGLNMYPTFQSLSENSNRLEQNTVHNHNGGIPVYMKVQETMPGYASQPQSTYYKPNSVRPLGTTSGHSTGQTPYSYKQPLNKPEVTDHYYLTRPLSVISTPQGPHYLPQRLDSWQESLFILPNKEFYHHHPNSALEYEKPKITVFAENIYFNNENPQNYGHKIDSSVGIQNEAKSDLLKEKISVLKRIIASIYSEKSTITNSLQNVDLPSVWSVKPNNVPLLSKPLNFLGVSSQSMNSNEMAPQSKGFPDEVEHRFSEKVTDNQSGQFHPLLGPFEYFQQKTSGRNPTNDKTDIDNAKNHGNEETAVEISTDIKGVAGRHEQGEMMINVERINTETED